MIDNEDEVTQMRAAVNVAMAEIGVDPLDTDEEGNHVFRYGCASGTIRVVENGPFTTLTEYHVVGVAVVGVRATKALLEELNSINTGANGTTVFLQDGKVRVSRVVGPANSGSLAITSAMAAVGWLAARIGPTIAAVYGGQTPYPYCP